MSAIEAIERYADGYASLEELRKAAIAASIAASQMPAMSNGRLSMGRQLAMAVESVARTRQFTDIYYEVFWDNEMSKTALFFQDVFPFRPVAFLPRWRTADVIGVARSIYDSRSFDRMPLLSDALLDADCDDEAIIAHCRSSTPHVRGCWAVDAALGLE